MKKLCVSLAALLAAAGPALVNAQSDYEETPSASATRSDALFDNRWYITPFASYTWADSDRGTDDGWGGGIAAGKPINQWLNLELRTMYSELNRDDDGQGSFDIWDIGLDAQVFFRRDGFQPFLIGGIGTTYDDFTCDGELRANGLCTKEGSDWSFMANAGAGFLMPITENILFRMDGRYRYETNQGGFNGAENFGGWILSAGIQIPLGPKAAAAPVTRTYSLSADALFDFDDANLRPQGRTRIADLSRDLNTVNYSSVGVTGHTDPIGSAAYNQVLSERRADSVRTALVDDGVPADRINAQGVGATQLKVTPEDCAGAKSRAALIECYQPNRRVDVSVYDVSPKK